ncbi:hypothetical protein V6N12_031014 [Hibiscus sabdariffa]|uniref:Uncharacterized protein n=1 Tax=Hibiscus sabdariffa TaxID=183260 RepID=A0ABR2E7P1_9ROSI
MLEKVGLDVSDEECMQEIEVRDDALEEHEIKGRNGKLDGHESDYLDSSDPGEYGDDGESDEEICGAYSGKSSMGPRYDSKCVIPTWEMITHLFTIGFLSVDIYVDHKIDVGDGCQTNNEVVEGSKNRASEDSKEDGESEDGVDVRDEELGVDILGLEVAGDNLRAIIGVTYKL